MEWPTDEEVEREVQAVERTARSATLGRRVGALLFVVVFLVDVFGQPELLALVSKWCAL